MLRPPGADQIVDRSPLVLEMGSRLDEVQIAWETWGEPTSERDNAILICPAFSAHCHANSSHRDPSPGWWEGMIGPGRAFDTDRYWIVCPALLGGTSGTTGPLDIDPTTRDPWRSRFPVVTVRDMVAVHRRLLDHLGIERLRAVAGGSLGAMQALELAVNLPDRAERVIAVSGTDRTRPYTAAIRHIGRRTIMLDPAFEGGEYRGHGPTEGLKLARELGTLFYRSREEFNQRFPWDPIRPPSREGLTFDVQSYLDHQGNKARTRFDANSYLTMSLAMDLHDVWRHVADRTETLERIDAEFLIAGVLEDRLIPIDEQKGFHQLLVESGHRSQWRPVSSKIGHDAFLVELDMMTELFREVLG